MRIISKQKDYYDVYASYGVDPGQVYVRAPKRHVIGRTYHGVAQSFMLRKLPASDGKKDACRYRRADKYMHCVHIIICGKAYRFFYSSETPSIPYTDVNDIGLYIPSLVIRDGLGWTYAAPLPDLERDWSVINDEFQSPIVIVGVDYDSPCRDMVWDETLVKSHSLDPEIVLTDAPVLAMMGVASHIDGFEVWQKISNWVSVKPKELINVSNETKIVKAGFDTKTSFRNMDRTK